MTPAIFRWLILFALSMLLAGCGAFSKLEPLISGEAELFSRGMDKYLKTGSLETLKRIPQEYPQGEWGPRAKAVIALAEQQHQQDSRREQIEQKLAECEKEQDALVARKDELIREKGVLMQENKVLIKDNESLEMTLKRLKQVLIDTELQSN